MNIAERIMHAVIWGKELPPRPYRKSKDIFLDEQEKADEAESVRISKHICNYDCAKNGCSLNF